MAGPRAEKSLEALKVFGIFFFPPGCSLAWNKVHLFQRWMVEVGEVAGLFQQGQGPLLVEVETPRCLVGPCKEGALYSPLPTPGSSAPTSVVSLCDMGVGVPWSGGSWRVAQHGADWPLLILVRGAFCIGS